MLAGRLLRRTGIAVGVGAIAGAMGLAPAQGATAPSWRLTATIGPADGSTALAGLVVTSKRDAWVAANACDVPSSCSSADFVTLVEHWNGHAWAKVAFPQLANFRHIVAFGAASSADAWAFTWVHHVAVHWNGRTWKSVSIPSWVIREGPDGSDDVVPGVFSPSDVTVFSLGAGSYAAHYNGHRWTKLMLPATPSNVVVKSRDNIWMQTVAMVGKTQDAGILHWDGRVWRKLAVPAVKVPSGAQESLFLTSIAGSGNLWLQRDIERGSSIRPLYWQHWNGKSWSRLYPPGHVTFASGLSSDGHGGYWSAAAGPAPAFRSYFLHRTGRQWTWHGLPATKPLRADAVQSYALIPGTRQLLAAGQATANGSAGGPFTVIWQYGG